MGVRASVGVFSALILISGCGSDSGGGGGGSGSPGSVMAPSGSGGAGAMVGGQASSADSANRGSGGSAAMTPGTPAGSGGGAAMQPASNPTTIGTGGMAAMMPPGAGGAPAAGAAGTPAPGTMPTPSADAEDGDASKPVVTLTDVPCRDAGGAVFGFPSANLKVDSRDVILDYPCNKHEGAPMTFILNLHGTTPVEQHFYQEGYFSAYQFVASHNLIIATPSSVVQQWGNGDNGQDEPYLMHVIDYVYQNFGSKFDIKAMWVGGHSWGAMYTATFVCKDYIADKVKGAIIMSGLPTAPACTDRIALIDTNAEMDIGPPLDQSTWPMTHGCDASMMQMLGNNTETFWPNCDRAFVHANYLMLGKMHTDFMDKEVVQSIVDWIKLSRQSQP